MQGPGLGVPALPTLGSLPAPDPQASWSLAFRSRAPPQHRPQVSPALGAPDFPGPEGEVSEALGQVSAAPAPSRALSGVEKGRQSVLLHLQL